jgi:hypothetical protein
MCNTVNKDVQSFSLLFFPDTEAYKHGKFFSASGLLNSILSKISVPVFTYNVFNDNWDTHDVDNICHHLHLPAICYSVLLPYKQQTQYPYFLPQILLELDDL